MSESILVKIFESLYAGGDLEFKKMLVLWSLYYDLVNNCSIIMDPDPYLEPECELYLWIPYSTVFNSEYPDPDPAIDMDPESKAFLSIMITLLLGWLFCNDIFP